METLPNYTFFNLFILSATLQGFLYCIFLLTSKKFNTKVNRYLTYTILLISVYNLYFWFIDTKLYIVLGWKCYKALFISWELLMLPMYFYFVASYLDKKQQIKAYYKYPFYLSLINHIIIVTCGFIIKDFFIVYENIVSIYDVSINYFSLLFTVFMVFKIFKLIYNYEAEKKEYQTNSIFSKTKWLKQLLFSTLGFCALSFSILLYNTINPKTPINDDFVWAIMSVFLYWLCYAGVYYVGIFNQRKIIRSNIFKTKINSNQHTNINNRFSEIDKYIKSKKSYLDSNLTLTSLSKIFDLSDGYISQLINTNTGVNFSTYINNLRIEESKLLLTNSEYKNYTIIAIALESGFNSKSAFYNSFKKSTGVSPSAFRKNISNLS